MRTLEKELADYDGKHVETLQELFVALEPKASVFRQCIRLSASERWPTAMGATWLLYHWLKRGAKLTAKLVEELVAQLPDISNKWAQMHIARSVPMLKIGKQQADAFAQFLDRCRTNEMPFLRAWALDSLHRLAMDHDACQPIARAALEQALDDPAPTVRARVRSIQRGE